MILKPIDIGFESSCINSHTDISIDPKGVGFNFECVNNSIDSLKYLHQIPVLMIIKSALLSGLDQLAYV